MSDRLHAVIIPADYHAEDVQDITIILREGLRVESWTVDHLTGATDFTIRPVPGNFWDGGA